MIGKNGGRSVNTAILDKTCGGWSLDLWSRNGALVDSFDLDILLGSKVNQVVGKGCEGFVNWVNKGNVKIGKNFTPQSLQDRILLAQDDYHYYMSKDSAGERD